MENVKGTIVVYTYRYIWKTKDGKLCVKFITEPQEGHMKFQSAIIEDEFIVSCMREYVNEVNFEYLGFTEPVKEEKKDVQVQVQEEEEKIDN